MNKKLILWTLLTISASLSNAGYCQLIKAGIVTADDVYHDIIPDDLLMAVDYNPMITDSTIYLDLDGNGTNDFIFNARGGGGLGGGSCSFTITPVSSNKVLSHPETSMQYPGVPVTVNVADTMNYGDSISSSSNNFTEGTSYLLSKAHGAQPAPNVSTWYQFGDKYIGVQLRLTNVTLFGWIRVNVSFQGYYTMTIKDFACNRNPYMAIDPGNVAQLDIYPNPVSNNLTIRLPGNNKLSRVSLLSLNGQILFQKTFSDNLTSLDLTEINNGIYILKIEIGDTILFKKIVKE